MAILKVPRKLQEIDVETSIFFQDLINQLNSNVKYFGKPSVNGSWRIVADESSGDLLISKLESGVWVLKSTISA